MDPREAYLDLIKRAVTNYPALGGGVAFEKFNSLVHYDTARGGWQIAREAQPLTLLSKGQLDLLEKLMLDVVARRVAGDCIEAGAWRGGAVALMAAVMRAHGITGRRVVAADSFAGIPMNEQFRHDPVDLWPDRWAASEAEVRGTIARLGLLDDRVEFLTGNFADSLPGLAGRRLALVRLDSDAYDSVMTSLDWLYPLLMPGGVLVIDDWHLIGCRLAVDAYRARHAITDPVEVCAGNGYWFKTQPWSEPARG